MKPYKDTELYKQFKDNLQIGHNSDYGAIRLIRTDVALQFQRAVDLSNLSEARNHDYIRVASDMLLEDAVKSVRRKCGIEDSDRFKIEAFDTAIECYGDDTYRLIPITYLETMYRIIVDKAPYVLSSAWKDAFMAGIKEANRRAGRTND